MRQWLRQCFYVLPLWLLLTASAVARDVHTRAMAGDFSDIKERVVMALENRGLTLNYTAKVGDMLDRTGRDLGRAHSVYGRAEVLEFCSARLSRDTMEADPHNIVFCPYTIAVYTLADAPRTVYVSYRSPAGSGGEASRKALKTVEQLLAEVVSEALK